MSSEVCMIGKIENVPNPVNDLIKGMVNDIVDNVTNNVANQKQKANETIQEAPINNQEIENDKKPKKTPEEKAIADAEKQKKKQENKIKKIEDNFKNKLELLNKEKELKLKLKEASKDIEQVDTITVGDNGISLQPIGKSKTFKEAFGTDKLIEHFDRKKAKYILEHWELYEKYFTYDNDDSSKYDPKDVLTAYLKKSKGLDYVMVKYNKSITSKKDGRWFADKSISIQNMPRLIRHTICKDIWFDLDFKNCHPVILEQLCNYWGISCPFLQKYNNNREDMLTEIINETKCSRDDAKKGILKTLNGGNIEFNVKWWKCLQLEFKRIAEAVASRNDFKKIKINCSRIKIYNLNARIMNCILCIYENKCLESLYEYLTDNHVINGYKCCLIFDGLQVPKTPHNVNRLTSDFLKEASQFINSQVGLNLEITIKDFDECIEIPDEVKVEDTFLIECGDDLSASEYILKKNSGKLKKCDGRVFVYNDGIWSDDDKTVNDTLTSFICKEDIRKIIGEGTAPYSRCAKSVENCKKMILASNSYCDDNFIRNIFKSNLQYLAFKDGVWSFKENAFLPYPIEDREIYFTTKINRNFPKNTDTYQDETGNTITLEDAVNKVNEKIMNPILPDKHQQHYFLHIIARALAGHFEDKKWYVGQGLRDCGKGVLSLMLKLAFQGFIGVVKSENFLVKRIGDGDNAKKMSWLVPLEFVRLAISNEISFVENVSKIDGNMIKSFASGGDLQQARQNYKNEREFQIQASFIAMCNDFPRIEPEDTYETLEAFIFKNKFVDKSLIIEGCPDFYQAKDEDIKGWCKNDYVIDAFTMIVLKHYQQVRESPHISIKKDIEMFKGDIKEPLEKVITKYVEHSNDKNDKLHTTDIVDHLANYGVRESAPKITSMLKVLKIGIYDKFRLNGKNSSGFTNISKKIIEEDEDEDE